MKYYNILAIISGIMLLLAGVLPTGTIPFFYFYSSVSAIVILTSIIGAIDAYKKKKAVWLVVLVAIIILYIIHLQAGFWIPSNIFWVSANLATAIVLLFSIKSKHPSESK